MATQLGKTIRELSRWESLPLCEVASTLENDIPYVNNMERGGRRIKQIENTTLADILKADRELLRTFWLVDQRDNVIEGQLVAD